MQTHRRLSALRALVVTATLSLGALGLGEAHDRSPRGRSGAFTDSADVVAAVARFHGALAAGDSATALTLLSPDAVILESGDLETHDEYRAHHLPADIAFVKAVMSERTVRRAVVRGSMAWVASTSTIRGNYHDRIINSADAELVVLVRADVGWRISAIHWSSHALKS